MDKQVTLQAAGNVPSYDSNLPGTVESPAMERLLFPMLPQTAGIFLPAALPALSAKPAAAIIPTPMQGGDATVTKKYGISVIPCTCFLTEMTRKK